MKIIFVHTYVKAANNQKTYTEYVGNYQTETETEVSSVFASDVWALISLLVLPLPPSIWPALLELHWRSLIMSLTKRIKNKSIYTVSLSNFSSLLLVTKRSCISNTGDKKYIQLLVVNDFSYCYLVMVPDFENWIICNA